MKNIVKKCVYCKRKISYEFRESEEDVPDKPICLNCKAFFKNGNRWIKKRKKQNPEDFKKWKDGFKEWYDENHKFHLEEIICE